MLVFSFFIVACSKVTQDNFDDIKRNMPMREVISILGEPTSTEQIAIGGFAGTAATWKDKNVQIDIQFLNDRVTVKSFNRTDI
ncbi:MAG: hypothetical protein H0W64_08155 [Gammaproteobacteria bacterium]|nr:hypothetical protein [Gammaproteobacteria bacterium]